MKIFIPKENEDNETRVAMIPAVAKKLVKDGATVIVEAGAGQTARIPDAAFTDAGATIGSASDWADADVVLMLHRPTAEQASQLEAGVVVIGQRRRPWVGSLS